LSQGVPTELPQIATPYAARRAFLVESKLRPRGATIWNLMRSRSWAV
jgi:hypothetical protein